MISVGTQYGKMNIKLYIWYLSCFLQRYVFDKHISERGLCDELVMKQNFYLSAPALLLLLLLLLLFSPCLPLQVHILLLPPVSSPPISLPPAPSPAPSPPPPILLFLPVSLLPPPGFPPAAPSFPPPLLLFLLLSTFSSPSPSISPPPQISSFAFPSLKPFKLPRINALPLQRRCIFKSLQLYLALKHICHYRPFSCAAR